MRLELKQTRKGEGVEGRVYLAERPARGTSMDKCLAVSLSYRGTAYHWACQRAEETVNRLARLDQQVWKVAHRCSLDA